MKRNKGTANMLRGLGKEEPLEGSELQSKYRAAGLVFFGQDEENEKRGKRTEEKEEERDTRKKERVVIDGGVGALHSAAATDGTLDLVVSLVQRWMVHSGRLRGERWEKPQAWQEYLRLSGHIIGWTSRL
uniref:Uncharacterized protein n=1 Tax=Chromera velia CCMP2878 TaxID=1169474 RepID=A0A0K6SAH8_9ALVE|eukprot:Cvel_1568.t2-p1 / transcript=Cvel_1568.t2 / gene=Cvel_1568 / organism=Chromera_velia_CCMP2878 / gene_product=hypothetical protein / transcript_product=hypothetical protein / location=Cvel_scaffold56:13557-13943(-) / protein_length=129 / sequence_SO=supercontig / SO=protein_coding / is_pseudo=false